MTPVLYVSHAAPHLLGCPDDSQKQVPGPDAGHPDQQADLCREAMR